MDPFWKAFATKIKIAHCLDLQRLYTLYKNKKTKTKQTTRREIALKSRYRVAYLCLSKYICVYILTKI